MSPDQNEAKTPDAEAVREGPASLDPAIQAQRRLLNQHLTCQAVPEEPTPWALLRAPHPRFFGARQEGIPGWSFFRTTASA